MHKGFSIPLALIVITVLAIIPLAFWGILKSVSVNDSRVKGFVSSRNDMDPGFTVTVKSNSQTWNFVQYLCETKDLCEESLESGKKLATYSGGKTDGYDIEVKSSGELSGSKYVKVFVRSSWPDDARFKVVDEGYISGTEVVKLKDDEDKEFETVIIPVEQILATHDKSATFSDN